MADASFKSQSFFSYLISGLVRNVRAGDHLGVFAPFDFYFSVFQTRTFFPLVVLMILISDASTPASAPPHTWFTVEALLPPPAEDPEPLSCWDASLLFFFFFGFLGRRIRVDTAPCPSSFPHYSLLRLCVLALALTKRIPSPFRFVEGIQTHPFASFQNTGLPASVTAFLSSCML